ncbi:MAG: hypothetical protein MI784_09380 [Cytophagales bacterium]|nr:hypothetical protein [Cytophagales bacterium]
MKNRIWELVVKEADGRLTEKERVILLRSADEPFVKFERRVKKEVADASFRSGIRNELRAVYRQEMRKSAGRSRWLWAACGGVLIFLGLGLGLLQIDLFDRLYHGLPHNTIRSEEFPKSWEQSFAQKDFEQVVQILSSLPIKTDKQRLFLGVAALEQQELSLSRASLSEPMQGAWENYRTWYLAMNHLRSGKKQEAYKLLKQIAGASYHPCQQWVDPHLLWILRYQLFLHTPSVVLNDVVSRLNC